MYQMTIKYDIISFMIIYNYICQYYMMKKMYVF